jgi:hypothetical protein
MEVSGQLDALAALAPGKQSQYPLCWRLGKLQSQSWRSGLEKNLLPFGELNLGSQAMPTRPIGSESVDRHILKPQH